MKKIWAACDADTLLPLHSSREDAENDAASRDRGAGTNGRFDFVEIDLSDDSLPPSVGVRTLHDPLDLFNPAGK